MCVDGRIKRSHNPGCCIVDTNLYRNNDIIQSFPNCTTHVCVDGQVMQLPSQECCRDLEGKWILRNQVVESNERKCLLKVCQGNNTILDKSLDDVCNCCRLGGQLYQENQVVVMSPCISLVCLNNKWERNDTLHNCQECFSAGDPHIRTLDGMYYNFYGKCNYTMVQRGMTGFTSPFIAAHFKTCGPPFRDAMSCNGEITIKHNDHIALVITEDATVQVNGARVTLPYSMPEENIFIWDEGMDIKIITFNGFYVRYTKHAVMPGMYVYAPSAEMNQTWSGLCGLYNGVREDDPHDSDGVLTDVANFATSWNTGVSSKIPSCKDDVKDVQATCTEELREKFEPKCKALLEMARANCTPILTEDGCLEDMCGCAPEKEHTCLLSIKHGLEHECGPITMDCPAAPDLTSPSSTCVDLDGVVRQDWEKFLVDCKEYVCRQGKIFLIKDGKRRCCSDVRNLTVYRNREKFTTGSGANCQTYVCKNGTISVYGPC
ncbi:BMP-binding endothelial regulator protein-like [Panulirus ornatus]|uniref:BMP-binding endothelial regulator protein-like n=1 Tax=Panulirus ornatus TaxID=150431 RepID=UPI003A891349